MKYPHFFPVSRKCKNAETRQKLETTYQSRCLEENTKILEQLVELRQDQADLLGYENHAAYIHELRMAKNPAIVKKFLGDLAEKLQPLWAEEKKELLQLKETECKENGLDFDGKLNFWDMRYYSNMIEEKKYSVDQEKLKEYFPLNKVMDGLLKIYQQLLGLTFHEVKDADKWHEDVSMYSVLDTQTEELMGYFYLDLHPRYKSFKQY
jgi:thimet oligopeptidase